MVGGVTNGPRSRDDFSFDARYGRLQRKTGIGTVPFALLYYQGELDIEPAEVWLIVYVLAHRWTSDLPYPAIREIERRSGVSKKTLLKYKAALETKGYLEAVHRTRPDGGNTSIGWDFSPLFERIDELIMRDLEWWKTRNPHFIDEEPWETERRGPAVERRRPAGGDGYTGPGVSAAPGPGVTRSPRGGKGGVTAAGDAPTPHVKEEPIGEDAYKKKERHPLSFGRTQTAKTRGANDAPPLASSAQADTTSIATIWAAALDDLREQILPTNFVRWLSRARLLGCAAGAAVVGVPDRVSAEQLARRFDALVRQALSDACGEAVVVEYRVLDG